MSVPAAAATTYVTGPVETGKAYWIIFLAFSKYLGVGNRPPVLRFALPPGILVPALFGSTVTNTKPPSAWTYAADKSLQTLVNGAAQAIAYPKICVTQGGSCSTETGRLPLFMVPVGSTVWVTSNPTTRTEWVFCQWSFEPNLAAGFYTMKDLTTSRYLSLTPNFSTDIVDTVALSLSDIGGVPTEFVRLQMAQ